MTKPNTLNHVVAAACILFFSPRIILTSRRFQISSMSVDDRRPLAPHIDRVHPHHHVLHGGGGGGEGEGVDGPEETKKREKLCFRLQLLEVFAAAAVVAVAVAAVASPLPAPPPAASPGQDPDELHPPASLLHPVEGPLGHLVACELRVDDPALQGGGNGQVLRGGGGGQPGVGGEGHLGGRRTL